MNRTGRNGRKRRSGWQVAKEQQPEPAVLMPAAKHIRREWLADWGIKISQLVLAEAERRWQLATSSDQIAQLQFWIGSRLDGLCAKLDQLDAALGHRAE